MTWISPTGIRNLALTPERGPLGCRLADTSLSDPLGDNLLTFKSSSILLARPSPPQSLLSPQHALFLSLFPRTNPLDRHLDLALCRLSSLSSVSVFASYAQIALSLALFDFIPPELNVVSNSQVLLQVY